MSLSFSVVYQKESRRVTCERSATVAQLVGIALEKFKLPRGANGSLLYGGKRLDPASPLRFTNLVNNGKLVLELGSHDVEVNLKVVATVLGQQQTQIVRLRSGTVLPEMVAAFCAKSGSSWPDSATVSVSVLHNVVESTQAKFAKTTVGEVVGHVPSAVLRMNVDTGREKAQEKKAPFEASGATAEAGVPESSVEKPQKSAMQDVRSDIRSMELGTVSQEKKEVSPVEKEKLGLEKDDISPMEKITPVEKEKITPVEKEEITPVEIEKINPVEKDGSMEDVVYVPSSGFHAYENPDEDYELTSSQAEKYYKMLKSMQSRPGKKAAFSPSHYTVRLRFPDRALLDLHFPDPDVKLGHVLKKIDSYINEPYVNAYRIKSSLPPFQEIQTNFSSNNRLLKELPEFQSEKVLLIWEPSSPAGNYLKSSIATRDVSESPTVKLETSRASLADDTPAPKKKASGLPKWFKPGK